MKSHFNLSLVMLFLLSNIVFAQNERIYIKGNKAKQIGQYLKLFNLQQESLTKFSGEKVMRSVTHGQDFTLQEVITKELDSESIDFQQIKILMNESKNVDRVAEINGLVCAYYFDNLSNDEYDNYYCIFDNNLRPMQKRTIYDSLKSVYKGSMSGFAESNSAASDQKSKQGEYFTIANQEFCKIEYEMDSKIISEYKIQAIGDDTCME